MRTAAKAAAPRLVPGLDVRAGQTVAGKYRVEDRVGTGPSGIVLNARNVHMREPVTLKILAAYTDGQDAVLEKRLAKTRQAARLRGPHVARIVDVGTTETGLPYVATERLEGRTLEAELDANGRMAPEDAVRWALEACEGLAEGHAMGLVHGDLKPANIFLASSGATDDARARMKALASEVDAAAAGAPERTLKILDFGMTSPLESASDGTSAFFGSPAYLSPEQIKDSTSIDARSDVWALGVILYEMLSCSLPFTADSLSGVLVAVVYDAPPLLTDVPYDLAKVVHRCLAKDPADRPQDVLALARELEPFAGASGERLSDRVRVALSTPPPDDADASGSISPVAIAIAPRLLAKRKRAATPASDTTRPSRRVLATRQRRARSGALLALAAAAMLALAAFRHTTAEDARAAAELLVGDRAAQQEPTPVFAATLTNATLPARETTLAAATPNAEANAEANASAKANANANANAKEDLSTSEAAPPTTTSPASASATSPASASSTTATTHAPIAAAAAPPPPPRASVVHPRRPPVPPPVPMPHGPSRSRLPPGLPTTREAATPPPAPPRKAAPPPPDPPRQDDTYLRNLFNDRK